MGTPFTPAITLPSSLALFDPDARAKPSPSERVQSAVFQHVLEADPPGMWGANRAAQTNHDTGVIAIAAKAYLDAIGGSKIVVHERKVASKFLKSGSAGIYARDDEYEPADPDCPLCQIIEQPGGEDGVWSMHQECAYLTLQHLLTGEAPAWTPCNDAGKPVRFFSLTSALVQPSIAMGVDARYPRGAYRVTPYAGGMGFYMAGQVGAYALLPGEEVARFREFHPWSRNLGMSRLESGAKEIDVLEAITASRWAMSDHGLQLDTVAMLPGASEETIQAFQKTMQQKAGGARNARRFLAVGGPSITEKWQLQTFGQSAREMDYQQSYDQAAGIVLAMFRVPKGVGGFTSQSTYSQHYAELQQFWDLGIIPYCRGLGVFLTQSLAKPWCTRPGQYRIEVEAQKPKDVEMQSKTNDTGLQTGAIDVNEWRKVNDWPTKPDGDAPLPVYIARLQQAIAPQPQPGALPPGGEEQGQEGEPQEGDDSPEATQDSATNAALAMLGIPAGGDAEPVAKALPMPTKPSASGVYTDSAGRKYRLEQGKRVPIGGSAPTSSAPAPAPAEEKPPFPRYHGRTPPPLPAEYLAQLKTRPTPPPLPPEHVAKHAASVKAESPQAKQTLASVQQWAKVKADQHAGKVAAHFGIPRAKAHALLVHAITAVAQHAAKTGGKGASGTMKVGGKQLRVSLPGQSGAPKPANPDGAGSKPPFPRHAKAMSTLVDSEGGFLVEPGCGVRRRKKKKPVAMIARKVLKSLEEQG